MNCAAAPVAAPVEPPPATPSPPPSLVVAAPVEPEPRAPPEPDWELDSDSRPQPEPAEAGLPGRVSPTPLGSQEPRIAGALATTLIRNVVRGALNEFRTCWELSDTGAAEGMRGVRFVIGPEGRVTEVTIDRDGPEDPVFDECLTRAIRGLDFPPPGGGGSVTIAYPIRSGPLPPSP